MLPLFALMLFTSKNQGVEIYGLPFVRAASVVCSALTNFDTKGYTSTADALAYGSDSASDDIHWNAWTK